MTKSNFVGLKVSALNNPIPPSQRRYVDIIQRIVDIFVSGDLIVGSRLPSERALSAKMNVSRASLREALVALEVAGIVRVKPGSGVFIAENALENLIKISDVTSLISPLEILEARSLLEPQISGLAATRRTKSDLTNLQQLNEVMEARLDEELDSWDADWGFHAAIAQASKNSSAQRLLENIREQMDQPVWALTRARNLKRNDHGRKYLREHQEIYDSLELGDSGIAKKSMAKHIKSITQDLDEVHERGVRLIRSVKT